MIQSPAQRAHCKIILNTDNTKCPERIIRSRITVGAQRSVMIITGSIADNLVHSLFKIPVGPRVPGQYASHVRYNLWLGSDIIEDADFIQLSVHIAAHKAVSQIPG